MKEFKQMTGMTEQELEQRFEAALVAYALEKGTNATDLVLDLSPDLWQTAGVIWGPRRAQWRTYDLMMNVLLPSDTIVVREPLWSGAKTQAVLKSVYLSGIKDMLNNSTTLLKWIEEGEK